MVRQAEVILFVAFNISGSFEMFEIKNLEGEGLPSRYG